MEKIWNEMYAAARAVRNERKVSDYVTCGEVAAAVLSKSGRIYTGVCIDTCSSLGICAERNAIFNMITNGEQEIDKVLCIMPDGSCGAPCGACRELMVQLRVVRIILTRLKALYYGAFHPFFFDGRQPICRKEEQKSPQIRRLLGLRFLKERIFVQSRHKAQSILYVLASILTQSGRKSAF